MEKIIKEWLDTAKEEEKKGYEKALKGNSVSAAAHFEKSSTLEKCAAEVKKHMENNKLKEIPEGALFFSPEGGC